MKADVNLASALALALGVALLWVGIAGWTTRWMILTGRHEVKNLWDDEEDQAVSAIRATARGQSRIVARNFGAFLKVGIALVAIGALGLLITSL
jgi:hypothetical protein